MTIRPASILERNEGSLSTATHDAGSPRKRWADHSRINPKYTTNKAKAPIAPRKNSRSPRFELSSG